MNRGLLLGGFQKGDKNGEGARRRCSSALSRALALSLISLPRIAAGKIEPRKGGCWRGEKKRKRGSVVLLMRIVPNVEGQKKRVGGAQERASLPPPPRDRSQRGRGRLFSPKTPPIKTEKMFAQDPHEMHASLFSSEHTIAAS